MSESGRESLPNVQEWSGDPSKCLGVVGRPYRMFESCREASRMSGSGRNTIPDVQESSGDPSDCLRVVGRPSRMCGSGWLALPDVREW